MKRLKDFTGKEIIETVPREFADATREFHEQSLILITRAAFAIANIQFREDTHEYVLKSYDILRQDLNDFYEKETK